jgi:N-acetylmuramoyl-L-alanine amidase CwlA
MFKVFTDYVPEGHPNRPGIKLRGLKARVWHGTANFNSTANDTMHRAYMGRPYQKRWNQDKGKYEFFETSGAPFAFGGAHVYIDKDSATIMCPLDEVVWGCGDRPLLYDPINKGQKPLAKQAFNNEQNYMTWNIELCMNDMTEWTQVLNNAIEFIKQYMPNLIDDFRHYDVTGKPCPMQLVDNSPNICPAWADFKNRIKENLNPKPDENLELAKRLFSKGYIKDIAYWHKVLQGQQQANPDFLRVVFSNAIK